MVLYKCLWAFDVKSKVLTCACLRLSCIINRRIDLFLTEACFLVGGGGGVGVPNVQTMFFAAAGVCLALGCFRVSFHNVAVEGISPTSLLDCVVKVCVLCVGEMEVMRFI